MCRAYMPYEVVPKGKGYVVMSQESHRPLSKRPLTKSQARKQQIAVALAESRRNPGMSVRRYFA